MSLESIFTSDQLDAIIKAPLDVAVLAAEADFELEDIANYLDWSVTDI